jgi:dCMP deaminase
MKKKFINAYIDVAERFSQLSSAERLKVGAIVVKDDRIVSIGYNGTPSGWDNVCEHEQDGTLVTKAEVLHAEMNCIGKLAGSGESGKDAAMFITHAPCMECAKLIHSAGISQVFYKNDYRSRGGIDFLNKAGVSVTKID